MNQKIKDLFNKAFDTASTVVSFTANKLPAIALLAYAGDKYTKLPTDSSNPIPFVEAYYASLTVGALVLIALLLRILIFPEVADYAEKGKLKDELATGKFTPSLVHYWFATALCFIAAILCFATIPK